jgi:ABC-type nickel/cobalt efflux system permease component RcnA
MTSVLELQRWLYGGATGGLKTVATAADPGRLLSAMGVAVLFGMAHALMPGHGKSVLVSYYLGRPSRIMHGVVSSSILVLTHVGMAVLLVMAGFAVIQRTLAGAGRAPFLEAASSALIIAIGIWLLAQALRGHHHHEARSNRLLPFAAGFVPCPLTTFIMVYALGHGMIGAGLAVTAAMAGGMILTISAFAAAAVLCRDAVFYFLQRREHLWHKASHVFEIASAIAVIGAGIWLLSMR